MNDDTRRSDANAARNDFTSGQGNAPVSASTRPGGNGASGAANANATDAARNLSDAAAQAGTKAVSGINTQKTKAAESLSTVAQALRESSDQLRTQDAPGSVHQLVSTAADQVERFSSYMRTRSVSDLVTDVEQFARRQPTAFIGGAFILGLLGARFLKSSSRRNAGQSYSDATFDENPSNQSAYVDRRTSAGYWQPQEPSPDANVSRGSPTGGEVF